MRLLAAWLSLSLVACAADVAPAAPEAPEPPVIEWAGVPIEARLGAIVTYVIPGGGTLDIEPDGYRLLTPAGWGGELVIIGRDAEGPFVASFMLQGGLPDGCYVENEPGVERGAHIETRGVLWPKRSTFQAATSVGLNSQYPAGTRFCFDRTGQIVSTIAP